MVLAFTGLCWEEAVAVPIGNVSLDGQCLRIDRTASESGERRDVREDPKTRVAERTVMIPDIDMPAVRRLADRGHLFAQDRRASALHRATRVRGEEPPPHRPRPRLTAQHSARSNPAHPIAIADLARQTGQRAGLHALDSSWPPASFPAPMLPCW